ncbi:extracellular solute-binding protein [Vannielia litorea]|uniref:extracellular solute-binding protein n=1 Tax=Vannielia TaxID=2813041 RepID=UPI001C93CFF5|nr:extracellular solute-binding protein [Vannielia litorea]MBY6047901.1 extracellular solute-binding protein [Vannielia litorea]MBY6075315.1 extracellular solute-binding protein [Vannielia litorea]MBY6152198.1 extracellular solute-binding protein [Vannielia litorea]
MTMKKTILATTALTLVAGGVAAQDMADSMTVVSWGGAYQASQQKAYTEPYLAANDGVSVTWDESSPEAVAKLRAMNEAGNITWDLVDVEAADAIRLCDEGLAMEYDPEELAASPDGTSAEDDFGDMLVSDCFIPQIVFSTTFGYRTDMVPEGVEPPTGACDVFDLEKYPGKRALNKQPIANMEWALLCDGVAYDDVYDVLETDEGQAQAFAKLDTIKDETIWWSASAEPIQMLADGEVFMGSAYNGRLFSAIVEQDQPIGMAWDWQMFDIDGWVVPAGLPEDRLARVKDFLFYATDTQRLADQAKYISYGPARASSAPLVGQHAELGIEMAPHMPTDPNNAENTFVNNYSWWADYRDDLDAKFQAWLAQ